MPRTSRKKPLMPIDEINIVDSTERKKKKKSKSADNTIAIAPAKVGDHTTRWADKKHSVRYDAETNRLTISGGRSYYRQIGEPLNEYAHAFECFGGESLLVVYIVHRQNSTTSVSLTFTTIDGSTKFYTDLCPFSSIERVLSQLLDTMLL